MSFEKGTLIYVNYTAKVKDTGEAIESTVEEDAKRLNIYDAERRYEPRLVSVGEEWVLKGLDEEIGKMDTGERKTVELLPEKAWGDRDPTQLRMIPIRKFGDKADELGVGDVVEVDNRVGVVRFIGSGRAQVDFNHRLAGKTLVYDVEVVKKVETEDDKIRSLIKRRFPGEAGDRFSFTNAGNEVAIEVPEAGFLTEGLQVIKRGIANDIMHFLPTTDKVSFKESYARREPARPTKPAEDTGTEGESEEKGSTSAEPESTATVSAGQTEGVASPEPGQGEGASDTESPGAGAPQDTEKREMNDTEETSPAAPSGASESTS